MAGYPWRVVSGIVLLSLSACSGSAAPVSAPTTPARSSTAPTPTTTATKAATKAATKPAADPASVHANELGVVPVLMYHQLLAQPQSDYDQTPAQFRAELEQLYGAGFRTVTADALVRGVIDLRAGQSPMVLTFDDSTLSQYSELANGSVNPASAVGILLAVAKEHGEDKPVATFYVNAVPFAGKQGYLTKLTALGMELGEHTATHANLRQLDATGVQRELAQGLDVITSVVPGAHVTTMALPYGAEPHDPALAHTGAYAGTSYNFSAVLLVGSNPAKSPYAVGFDPLQLPRIRSGRHTGDQSFTASYWLPRLPGPRYISDGDPAVISFPKAESPQLNPRFASQARPY